MTPLQKIIEEQPWNYDPELGQFLSRKGVEALARRIIEAAFESAAVEGTEYYEANIAMSDHEKVAGWKAACATRREKENALLETLKNKDG